MKIRIPAEFEPHACCYFAWAVHSEWGKKVNKVKAELGEVIHTVARFEPVRLLAPAGPALHEARREFSRCRNITVIEAPVDDIWMRDIAPTFALRGNGSAQEVVAIDWNFNAWGATKHRPPRPGDRLTSAAASIFGVPRVTVPFVAEGGALATDGRGTLATTRSCLLNAGRNPAKGRGNPQQRIERALAHLGIRWVIWLEGDPCEELTNGHIDGYVLFAPSGVVLVEVGDTAATDQPMWREYDANILERTEDECGVRFKVIRVREQGYLNAYVANGAVITASFGSRRDAAAKAILGSAFPDREVVVVKIDTLFNEGGGVHCLTQSMPILGCHGGPSQ